MSLLRKAAGDQSASEKERWLCLPSARPYVMCSVSDVWCGVVCGVCGSGLCLRATDLGNREGSVVCLGYAKNEH